MKKTITTIALLAGAVSCYSQAEIDFAGDVSGFKQIIYSANPLDTEVQVSYGGYTTMEQQGSSATSPPETPTGTTVYHGAPLGAGYEATLLGAPGTATLSQLLPLPTSTGSYATLNFYTTGTPLGTLQGAIPVVTGASGGLETIAIAVWQDTGPDGAANTLAAAQQDGYDWGISPLSNITSAPIPSAPTPMATASNLNLSFSLGTEVPEPSTVALGVMGVATLLFRRRNKDTP